MTKLERMEARIDRINEKIGALMSQRATIEDQIGELLANQHSEKE